MSDSASSERYRPQFHYTTAKGWINDPIGLVFYKGEYHLFNDHNPFSCDFPGGTTDGEQSHWSHGISTDLVHWERMPIAVYPDKNGACWSGSGLVDWQNTTGFQTGEEPPLVVVFTSAGGTFTQSLAYSNDRGRTWHKHDGNPVLHQIADGNRDPKVFWHEPTSRWIMVLYVELGSAHFFTSTDLKEWAPASVVELDDFHECPDMFQLPVDGDPEQVKWILHDARFRYWIGDFDGETFTPELGPIQGDVGKNFYAAQSWCDSSNRRVQIGWMCNGSYPDMPFSQQMSFPCELQLRTVDGDARLFRNPVRQIESIRADRFELRDETVAPCDNPLSGISGDLFDIEMEVDAGSSCGIRLHETDITCSNGKISCLGCSADAAPVDGSTRLRVLVDRASIEVFANDGAVSISSCFLPKHQSTGLEFFAADQPVSVRSLKVYRLKSIWPTAGEHPDV